ncbi:MAG: glycine/betaine ABC transporter substrate-binding protein [Desulfobacteraceae bacterium]|nr:glycine/betaine ABC transporter substrate-binding protein [Desulfobacteraceae bacterium]
MRTHLKKGLTGVVGLLCLTLFTASGVMAEKAITIGGKNFTEQYILPELAKHLLEKNGFTVTLKTGVSTSLARKSLETAQVDFYFEYTGTAYTLFYKGKDTAVMTDPQKVYDWMKQKDAAKGLIWLDSANLNNTFTLMMKKEEASRAGIKTISDLGAAITKDPKKFVLAVSSEFWERPDGIKKLMKVYGFRVPVSQIKKMDPGITYMALKNGQVDVAMGFATDGRIVSFGLVNMEDDKNFFPVYNAAPVIRKEVLDAYPEIREILKPLTENLTTEEMQTLNKAVDVDHKKVSAVTLNWLKEKGLL